MKQEDIEALLAEQVALWRSEADAHREREGGFSKYAEAQDDCAMDLEEIVDSIRKNQINRFDADGRLINSVGGDNRSEENDG